MDGTWLEITLPCAREELDAVCAKLTMNGVTGLQIEDEEEFRTFLEQNRQYWDYVDQELLDRMKGVTRVKFYVTDDEDGKKQDTLACSTISHQRSMRPPQVPDHQREAEKSPALHLWRRGASGADQDRHRQRLRLLPH